MSQGTTVCLRRQLRGHDGEDSPPGGDRILVERTVGRCPGRRRTRSSSLFEERGTACLESRPDFYRLEPGTPGERFHRWHPSQAQTIALRATHLPVGVKVTLFQQPATYPAV